LTIGWGNGEQIAGGETGGTWTVTCDGADFWGTSDKGGMAYHAFNGDFDISCRLVSVSGRTTDPWTRGGIMARNSLAASSPNALVYWKPVQGDTSRVDFNRREGDGGDTKRDTGFGRDYPVWMRLQRAGDTFTAYQSDDGGFWFPIRSRSIAMNDTIYAGFAVSSHDAAETSTYTFDNVEGFAIHNDMGATNVLMRSAVLQAELLDTGGPTYVKVYWGPTDGGQTQSVWSNVQSFATAQSAGSIGTNVTGLIPDTVYYYRYHASNANWQVWSPVMASFHTPSLFSWDGDTDDMWDTALNWSSTNVPDVVGEFAKFDGTAPGEVDLNGGHYTIDNARVTAGDYVLTNSGAVAMLTVTGTTAVTGGSLTFSEVAEFNTETLVLSNCKVVVDGALTAEGTLENALLHRGFNGENDDNEMSLDGNGGLMSLAPYATVLFTDGPRGRGLDFDNDADFLDTGAVGQGDRFANLFVGYFNPPESGAYEFRLQNEDDRGGIWIDLDRDGVFESSQAGLGQDRGEQLAWEDRNTHIVALTGGSSYLFGVTHRESVGGSGIDVRFRMPGEDDWAVVNPGDPEQNGFWTLAEGGVDAGHLSPIEVLGDAELAVVGVPTGQLGTVKGGSFGDVVLSNGTLTMTAGPLAVVRFSGMSGTGGVSIVGKGLVLDTDSSLGSLAAGGGADVTGATITASGKFEIEPATTIHNALAGAAYMRIGESDLSDSVVVLAGTNTYTGETQIERGVLEAGEGVGLSTNSCLRFVSDNNEQPAIFQSSGTFTRDIGQGPGQVYWGDEGRRGGFAARGGDLAVNLHGGATVGWKSGTPNLNQGNNQGALQFGSKTADAMVEFMNDIVLNDSAGLIQVQDNPGTTSDFVRISGSIGGGADAYMLRFNQNGNNNYNSTIVELTGSNTYSHVTQLDDCTVYAFDGAGLSTNSLLRFEGNAGTREAVLMSNGSFLRDIANSAGNVYWQEHGGFAARGGDLAVNLEGGITLVTKNGGNGFRNKQLQLNSKYADSMVDFQNDIQLESTDWISVTVFNNPATDRDLGCLSGVIGEGSSDKGWRKKGQGTLWLPNTNTYASTTLIDDGALRALDGVGLPVASRLYIEGDNEWRPCVLESSGTFTRDIANSSSNVFWGERGGFAAWGGPLTVNLEGGATLSWGSNSEGFNGKRLHLGSRTANDVVTLVNDVVLGGNRYVHVFDNPYSDADYAVMSGAISGNNQLYKECEGLLVLTGASTYQQETRIYDGELRVNGSLASSVTYVAFALGKHGVLSGTGTVNQIEVRDGGTLAPGASVGTLRTTGRVYMREHSTYAWELGPGDNDMVTVGGNVELQPGWKLKLLGLGGAPRADEQYDIFTLTGDMVYAAPEIDTSAMPSDWDVSNLEVVHDYEGKRVYLTGVSSTLAVANREASLLTSTSAQLNGTLSCSGLVMEAWVYWGESDGGTNAGAWSNSLHVGTYSNVVDQTLSHTAAGLSTNVRYCFTFRATNATHDMWAVPSEDFDALGPPCVDNAGATDIAVGEATLNGLFLDHNRGDVTVCWGLTDGGTNGTAAWDHVENIGEQSAATFAAAVSDAFYPLTYYYRCYATNAYGRDWSDPATSFTMTVKPGAPTNPVAYWALDETGGTGAADSSGNGRSGTLVAFPGDDSQWVAGRWGGALQFDGADDEVRITGYQGIKGSAPRTMSAWIKTINRDASIMSWGVNSGGRKWNFRTQTGNGKSGAIRVEVNGGFIVGDTDVCDDVWHHVVAVLPQGANNVSQMRLYVDGRSNTVSAVQGNAINTGSSDVHLGDDHADRRFSGCLDEAYIFDRELTEDEIVQLYSGGAGEGGQNVAIENVPATERTQSTVKLNATMNASKSVYDTWVYWGTTNGGTNVGAWDTNAFVGSYTDVLEIDVSHAIAGLTATSTPFYTFRLSNAVDSVWAEPSLSVSAVSAPGVDNGDGALVDTGAATLRGNLATGIVAEVYVYWGRSDGGTNAGAWDGSISLGNTPQGAFSTQVTAGYGDTYYYRCFATNAMGWDWGDSSTNFATLEPAGGQVTPGADFEVDAGKDTDGDTRWEDLVAGNPTGFDFELDNSPAVTRVTGVSSLPGITAAYGFPGGATGNEAGAQLSDAGTATRRSLEHAPGNWSTKDVTIEIWFKPADLNTSPANGEILFESGGGTGFGFFMNDNVLQLRKAGGSGLVAFNVASIADEFIQAVGTYDVSAGAMELFVNGESVGTSSPGGNDWSGSDPAGVGTRGGANTGGIGNGQSNTESFDGQVAIFRVYSNQILTPAEVLSNYDAVVDTGMGIANTEASEVGGTSAKLNAVLDANEWFFDVWAYYGSVDGTNNPGAWETNRYVGAFTDVASGTVSTTVTGLVQDADYYYAFFITNSVTNMWAAPSAAFRTQGGSLVVSNGAPVDVGPTQASLVGALIAGGSGEAAIFWGLDDGGTSHGAWANTSHVGTVWHQSFTSSVPLLAGATYHYRAYVTNAFDDAWAASTESFGSQPAEVTLSMEVTREDLGIDPLSIAGCELWLAADDIDGDGNTDDNPADGTPVDIWCDKSGHGRRATRDGVDRTAYNTDGPNGRPVVTFDGDYLSTSHNFDSLKEYTVFAVARYTGGDNERVISSATRNWLLGYNSNGDERFYAESWVHNAGTANAEWHVHAGHINSDADPKAGFWKDGVNLVTDGTGSHDSNYTIGRLALGGYRLDNQESKCEIAEVLIYNRVLSAAEFGRLGLYLSWKYGLDNAYTESGPTVVTEARGGFEVTAELNAVAISNVTVNLAPGTNAMGYAEGMRGSIFRQGILNDSAINLDGADYTVSDRRVVTGDKAGTILALDEEPDHNVIATGTIQAWSQFPAFDGNAEQFATVFSGTIVPRVSGSHAFRGQCDDTGWMYIDMAGDGVWDNSDRVFAGNASGSKALALGQPYNFVFMHREGAGGQSIDWYVTEPGGGEQRVSTDDQPGVWRCSVPMATLSNDYTVSGTSLVIPAGSVTSTSSIAITIVDDLDREDDEAVALGVASVVNATNGHPDFVNEIVSSRDPKVTVGDGATDLTGDSATLNAMLTMGDDAELTLYWGDTDGGTNHASWGATVHVGAVSEDVPYATTVDGVVAGRAFYYRCYVTNDSNLGEDWSDATTCLTNTASVTIGDIAVVEGGTGETNAVFTIAASVTGVTDVSVGYTTSNGTALAGADYTAVTGRVTLTAGAMSTQITVQVTGDTELEHPDEVFAVYLDSPTNCTIADGEAMCRIVDDDAGGYLAGFRSRMKITVAGYAGTNTLVNFPVLVRMHEKIDGFEYETFASSTGGDLRFVDSTGKTLLSHEIEAWNTNGESCVWVQLPTLPPGGTTFWARWGDEDETTPPAYTSDGSTWSDGYIAVWHLAEENGPGSTTAPDSADGNDGTLQNMNPSANWVDGMIANALNFASADNRVNVAGLGKDCGETTISFWARPTGGGERSIFHTKQGNAGDLHYFLMNGDNIRFWVNGAGFNPGGNDCDSTATLPDNQWTHWTAVYSLDAKRMKMYKNGSLETELEITGNQTIQYTHGLYIGANNAGTGREMKGRIDELRVGDVARSPDWIKACYDNQALGSEFVQCSDVFVPKGLLLIIR